MTQFAPEWVAHQQKRFLRHDAHRFLRHDWQRFVKPGAALPWPLAAIVEAKANFDPNQPRVPAGNSDGGQWTNDSNETDGEGAYDSEAETSDADRNASEEVGSARRNAGGGHHFVPRAIYKDKPLQKETKKIFDDATTGPIRLRATSNDDGLLRGHYWDGPQGAHGQYSKAVDDLLKDYMDANNITWEKMTPDQARTFLARVKESQEPRIRDYLNSIRLLQRLFRSRIGGRGME
jgi:hypothetical protein